MSDLVAWLRAQLDEDEQTAGSATSGPWDNDDKMTRDAVRAAAVDDWVADCRYEQMGPFAVHNATHIARWNPARVLAEVGAKRRIVELHAVQAEPVEQSRFDPDTGERRKPEYNVSCEVCGWATSDPTSACVTIRLLALPYATDREGYDEAWRP